MYIPEFLFEEEDIRELLKRGLIFNKNIYKKKGINYYKTGNIDKLVDFLFKNKIDFEYRSNIILDIKTCGIIFTNIVNQENIVSVLNCILSYAKINKNNATILIELL